MTTVYFVRHAEPNYENHDDLTRELTAKGLRDREQVTAYFHDKTVHAVLSSPYRRAVDTVAPAAQEHGLTVRTIHDLRERAVTNGWLEDFTSFAKAQWADHDYKLPGGESLHEVEARCAAVLREILRDYRDKTVVVGSHGTALSTLIHHFHPDFGYPDFDAIRGRMPWVVKFVFEGDACCAIETVDAIG